MPCTAHWCEHVIVSGGLIKTISPDQQASNWRFTRKQKDDYQPIFFCCISCEDRLISSICNQHWNLRAQVLPCKHIHHYKYVYQRRSKDHFMKLHTLVPNAWNYLLKEPSCWKVSCGMHHSSSKVGSTWDTTLISCYAGNCARNYARTIDENNEEIEYAKQSSYVFISCYSEHCTQLHNLRNKA